MELKLFLQTKSLKALNGRQNLLELVREKSLGVKISHNIILNLHLLVRVQA